MNANQGYLNSQAVMERLQISESTFMRLLRKHELTGFKVGREWRFTEEDIAAFEAKQRAKTQAAHEIAKQDQR